MTQTPRKISNCDIKKIAYLCLHFCTSLELFKMITLRITEHSFISSKLIQLIFPRFSDNISVCLQNISVAQILKL